MSKKSVPRTRRRFTDEFKQEAVQMLLDGHSAASVAERLGLAHLNILYRRKRQQLEDNGPVASSLDERVRDAGSGTSSGRTRTRHAKKCVVYSQPRRMSDVVSAVDQRSGPRFGATGLGRGRLQAQVD